MYFFYLSIPDFLLFIQIPSILSILSRFYFSSAYLIYIVLNFFFFSFFISYYKIYLYFKTILGTYFDVWHPIINYYFLSFPQFYF